MRRAPGSSPQHVADGRSDRLCGAPINVGDSRERGVIRGERHELTLRHPYLSASSSSFVSASKSSNACGGSAVLVAGTGESPHPYRAREHRDVRTIISGVQIDKCAEAIRILTQPRESSPAME